MMYRGTIYDPNILEVLDWVRTNCVSFVSYHTLDVSGVGSTHDTLARFNFAEEADLILFNLRWA